MAKVYFGNYIVFDTEKLSFFSDKAVIAVIAHEFAHVVNGENFSISIKEDEENADDTVISWGFSDELKELENEAQALKSEGLNWMT